jgi:small multidrug resistance family-3 protein
VTGRAATLFGLAAVAEIGGVCLVWRTLREGAPLWQGLVGAGLLVAYGATASLQSDPHFGRVLAAYGGIFVAGSLLWGVLLDGFRPQPRDLLGAGLCLAGMGTIMWGRG